MKAIIKTSIVIILFTCISCGNKKEKIEVVSVDTNAKEKTEKSSDEGELALNVSFSDARYNDAYKHYIAMKNALVASDAENAAKYSDKLGTAFANLGVEPSLIQSNAVITGSKDIEEQRKAFSDVSNEITALLSSAHIASGAIYKQYCPMAFDFKGAYWLSTEKEIRNPYFGDAMLKCGETKEEIN